MNPKFVNLEYFFKILIDWLRHARVDLLWQWLRALLEKIAPLITLLSVALVIGIIMVILKRRKIEHRERLKLKVLVKAGTSAVEQAPKNAKWDKVIAHINATSEGEWKLAVIEADIMLDELLDVLGYHGETMADKLKAVEPSDFDTLQSAWEAHKVRNQIAHESGLVLSEHEAKRVIGLYRSVFREFEYI